LTVLQDVFLTAGRPGKKLRNLVHTMLSLHRCLQIILEGLPIETPQGSDLGNLVRTVVAGPVLSLPCRTCKLQGVVSLDLAHVIDPLNVWLDLSPEPGMYSSVMDPLLDRYSKAVNNSLTIYHNIVNTPHVSDRHSESNMLRGAGVLQERAGQGYEYPLLSNLVPFIVANHLVSRGPRTSQLGASAEEGRAINVNVMPFCPHEQIGGNHDPITIARVRDLRSPHSFLICSEKQGVPYVLPGARTYPLIGHGLPCWPCIVNLTQLNSLLKAVHFIIPATTQTRCINLETFAVVERPGLNNAIQHLHKHGLEGPVPFPTF
jgi:hypothetical protein